MKGIQKIKKKILNDAKAIAKKHKDEANAEAKKVRYNQKKFRDEYQTQYEERTNALEQGVKQKSLAQARLEAKKEYLQQREEIIQTNIDEVITNLDHSSTHYKEYLKKTLADTQLKGNVTVYCASEDENTVKQLTEHDVTVNDSLSGGLIFVSENGQRIDESINSLLENKHNDIRQAIVALLN